jgi:hypothetical protein
MGKVVPYLKLILSYFIWNFWSQLVLPFDQISLNYFKLNQINAKLYRSSGLDHPFSSRAGPCAPADRLAPPISGTAAWHCAAAHPSGASLLALSDWHARARRTSSVSAALGPLPGGDRQSRPGPTAPLRRVAPPCPGPPTFFPPLSPLSRCRRAARSPLALLHSFPRPHSSPTPPLERPSFPTAPRTQTTAGDHRQPPLPRGFRPSTAAVRHSPVSSSPSYQSLKFLTNPSLPRLF